MYWAVSGDMLQTLASVSRTTGSNSPAQRPQVKRQCLENGVRLVRPREKSGRWHGPKQRACSPARGRVTSKAQQRNSCFLGPKMHTKGTYAPQHTYPEHKPDPTSKSLTYQLLLTQGFAPAEGKGQGHRAGRDLLRPQACSC